MGNNESVHQLIGECISLLPIQEQNAYLVELTDHLLCGMKEQSTFYYMANVFLQSIIQYNAGKLTITSFYNKYLHFKHLLEELELYTDFENIPLFAQKKDKLQTYFLTLYNLFAGDATYLAGFWAIRFKFNKPRDISYVSWVACDVASLESDYSHLCKQKKDVCKKQRYCAYIKEVIWQLNMIIHNKYVPTLTSNTNITTLLCEYLEHYKNTLQDFENIIKSVNTCNDNTQ